MRALIATIPPARGGVPAMLRAALRLARRERHRDRGRLVRALRHDAAALRPLLPPRHPPPGRRAARGRRRRGRPRHRRLAPRARVHPLLADPPLARADRRRRPPPGRLRQPHGRPRLPAHRHAVPGLGGFRLARRPEGPGARVSSAAAASRPVWSSVADAARAARAAHPAHSEADSLALSTRRDATGPRVARRPRPPSTVLPSTVVSLRTPTGVGCPGASPSSAVSTILARTCRSSSTRSKGRAPQGVALTALVIGGEPSAACAASALTRRGLDGAVELRSLLAAGAALGTAACLDVVAVTSHQEGLGIAALEAMASRLSRRLDSLRRAGGVRPRRRERLPHGLRRWRDRVALRSQVCEDRALRERLSAGARRTIEIGYSLPRAREILDRELEILKRPEGPDPA